MDRRRSGPTSATQRRCAIAGIRRDGSLRTPVIVWVVRVGDELYTRSVNGPDAAWFRGVQTRHRGQLSRGRCGGDVDFVDEAIPPTTT